MHKLVKVKVYGCLWNQILYNTTHFLRCSWNESREIIPSAPESTNRNYHSFLNIQKSNNPLQWTCLPFFTPYFNKDAFFGFLKFFIKKYLYMKLPFPLAWYPSKSSIGSNPSGWHDKCNWVSKVILNPYFVTFWKKNSVDGIQRHRQCCKQD